MFVYGGDRRKEIAGLHARKFLHDGTTFLLTNWLSVFVYFITERVRIEYKMRDGERKKFRLSKN